jgi:hypothetical protein
LQIKNNPFFCVLVFIVPGVLMHGIFSRRSMFLQLTGKISKYCVIPQRASQAGSKRENEVAVYKSPTKISVIWALLQVLEESF